MTSVTVMSPYQVEGNRDVRFGTKVGQNHTKRDKLGTFFYQIPVPLANLNLFRPNSEKPVKSLSVGHGW